MHKIQEIWRLPYNNKNEHPKYVHAHSSLRYEDIDIILFPWAAQRGTQLFIE